MRVLLIDDEKLALDILTFNLNKIEGIEIIGAYSDPHAAIRDLASIQVDAIFIDMEMGEFHGIDLAESILADYSHTEVIFVTAHSQFALEAFEVNAIDYLLKPVSLERLKKAISKTQDKLDLYHAGLGTSSKRNQVLYIYTMNNFLLIDLQENEVKWRTRKVKELFVYLWHHREAPVHKIRLLEELWPEMEAPKATSLLHTTVYLLRKKLKEIGVDNSVSLLNDRYLLTVPIDSDVMEIEKFIQAKDVNPSSIKRLLELYRGDYLEENDYVWGTQFRHWLKQSVLNYFEQFIELSHAHKEPDILVEKCLEKMLRLDMYNERYMYEYIDYLGRINNIKKMKDLYSWICETIEGDLGTEIPILIIDLYKYYLNKKSDGTNTYYSS
ncbi:response regulator [Salipaludibacillus neizhouensis]|nr:response regulator [Salipaludibacillus neizhouensis]